MIRMRPEVKKYLSDIKKNSKNAIFLALAAIGLTFLISGLLDVVPKAYGPFWKIFAGILILLVVGYLGYGILARKNRGRK